MAAVVAIVPVAMNAIGIGASLWNKLTPAQKKKTKELAKINAGLAVSYAKRVAKSAQRNRKKALKARKKKQGKRR